MADQLAESTPVPHLQEPLLLTHVGKLLGIEVLDHLIVGDDGRYYSFRNQGGLG